MLKLPFKSSIDNAKSVACHEHPILGNTTYLRLVIEFLSVNDRGAAKTARFLRVFDNGYWRIQYSQKFAEHFTKRCPDTSEEKLTTPDTEEYSGTRKRRKLNILHPPDLKSPNYAMLFFTAMKIPDAAPQCLQTSGLHSFVFNADEGVITSLLSQRADVNEKNAAGNTPLHLAVFANNTSMAKLLIAYKGEFTIPNNEGRSALQMAKQLDRKEMTKLFEDHTTHSNQTTYSCIIS